jgi:hypothetical protein
MQNKQTKGERAAGVCKFVKSMKSMRGVDAVIIALLLLLLLLSLGDKAMSTTTHHIPANQHVVNSRREAAPHESAHVTAAAARLHNSLCDAAFSKQPTPAGYTEMLRAEAVSYSSSPKYSHKIMELEGERKWQDSPWARAVLKALKRMVNDDSSVLGLGCAAYASGEEARTEWARHWCRVGAWMGGCGE